MLTPRIPRMPELTTRLRLRTLLTAASSEPDGCFTTRRHFGGFTVPRDAAAIPASSALRSVPGRCCCSMIETGAESRITNVPPAGGLTVRRTSSVLVVEPSERGVSMRMAKEVNRRTSDAICPKSCSRTWNRSALASISAAGSGVNEDAVVYTDSLAAVFTTAIS